MVDVQKGSFWVIADSFDDDNGVDETAILCFPVDHSTEPTPSHIAVSPFTIGTVPGCQKGNSIHIFKPGSAVIIAPVISGYNRCRTVGRRDIPYLKRR